MHTTAPARHRVQGFVHMDGSVRHASGFYCQNGPEIDGARNVVEGGEVKPGPDNNCPMYWAPDLGYSIPLNSFCADRAEAVDAARLYIAKQRVELDRLERAL